MADGITDDSDLRDEQQGGDEPDEEDEVSILFREAEYRVVKLSDMHPAEYNPRYDLQPGDLNYDNLEKSIINNGLDRPIVYNQRTGNIVDGHQRYKILLAHGVESATCAVVDMSLEDEMLANVALNQAHGSFDDGRLQEMFTEMDLEGIDPGEMGMDIDEVEQIRSGLATLTDEQIFDPTKEPDKKPAMVKCPACGKKFEERENRV